MTDLVFSHEHAMLRESSARFLDAESPVSEFRKWSQGDQRHSFDARLWSRMASQGWGALLVSEDMNGLGLELVSASVIAEEIGRRLVWSPFLDSCVMGVLALEQAGPKRSAAVGEVLQGIAAGEVSVAIALDEDRKHNPSMTKLDASANSDGWNLTGLKTFVPDVGDGPLVVLARISAVDSDLALVLVDANKDGVSKESLNAIDGRRYSTIRFNGVWVGREKILCTGRQVERVLDAGRIVLASEMLGIARECFDRTVRYSAERVQFGQKIGSFQALQHRMAHVYCQIELLHSCVLNAAQAFDANSQDVPRLASLAKVKANEVATLSVAEAIQLHGGIGMTEAMDFGMFLRRTRVCCELLGDADFHLRRYAEVWGY